jgi:hypothetical protein
MFGMSGHGRLPDCPGLECGPDFGEPDFWLGVGFEGVVGVVVVPLVPVPLVPAVVSVPLGAAAAPAMPAAAPPVASAPATIVAPSIFDTCMINLLSMDRGLLVLCEPSSTRPLSAPLGAPKERQRGV